MGTPRRKTSLVESEERVNAKKQFPIADFRFKNQKPKRIRGLSGVQNWKSEIGNPTAAGIAHSSTAAAGVCTADRKPILCRETWPELRAWRRRPVRKLLPK